MRFSILTIVDLHIFNMFRGRKILPGYGFRLLEAIIFHRRNLCSDTLSFGTAELPCP